MDLLYNKLKISKQEFLFQYQSHPSYPSVLAFSDTLRFLNVKNEAYEIEKQDWHELPQEFITIYNSKITYVEKKDDEYLIFSDISEKISKEKLHSEAPNLVILFEKTEDVKVQGKINYMRIFIFFAIIFLFYSAYNHQFHFFLFNILSIVGVFLSLEIFKNKYGEKSVLINSVCNSFNTASESLTNCSKIFSSDKISLLGLKLSDLSLVYFLSISLLGLLNNNEGFLWIISLVTIMVIVYSLIVQIFIEKSFCKVCFLIILILISQIIVGLLFLNHNLNFNLFFIPIASFAVVFFLITFINDILSDKEKYQNLSLKSIKFKKNYDIFKRELQEKHFIFNNKNEVFWFGEKNADLNISLITNPFCSFCKEAHVVLEDLINKYHNISVQIRFNYIPELADENFEFLISTFKNIYDNQGEKSLLEAIKFWYKKSDINEFKKEYVEFFKQTDLSDVIILAEENRNNGLTFTPVMLINNYQFPNKYEKEDIFYFIDELIEDVLNEKL